MKGRLRSIFVMLFAFIILFQFKAYADYVTDIGTQNNNVQLSNDVTYEVRHFKMKLDGTYASVPDEIEVIAGNTGETKLPAPKDYTGFIMPATKSITLKYPSSTNFIEYKYQRHRYTVTFNKNAASATGTMTNQHAYYGETFNLNANAYSYTGYTFSGWADTTTGPKVYDDAQPVTSLLANSGTKTLYAKWTPITYKIIYHGNGETSGSMSDQTITYDVSTRLNDNEFIRTGYTFIGWATSASGPVVYNDTEFVRNLSSVQDAEIHLYAKYKLEYTMFDTGSVVNAKLEAIVGDKDDVQKIIHSDTLKPGFVPTAENTISITDSKYEIYVWYEDNKLYWYCGDNTIYLNPDAAGMFERFTNATDIELTDVNTSRTTDFSEMYSGCNHVTYLNLLEFNTQNAVNSTDMFNGCVRLDTIDLGNKFTLQARLPAPDNNYITGANGKWFASSGFSYLPENIPSGVAGTYYAKGTMVPPMLAEKDTWYRTTKPMSDITTITVEDEHTMTGLEVDTWVADADQTGTIICYVTDEVLYIVNNGSADYTKMLLSPDISNMFSGFVNLETVTGLSRFNSVNVTTAKNVFGDEGGVGANHVKRLEGIESWNMSNLSEASYMFSGCGLPTLDLSAWNLSSLTSMKDMFRNCKSSTINLTGIDVDAVTNMSGAFQDCENLYTLYLSYWHTGAVTDSSNMFKGSDNLLTVYASAETDFTGVANTTDMFDNTSSIIGGYGTAYDSGITDGTYGRIDRSATNGYFTQYIIGNGNIIAKLYETDVVSNSFTELTASGKDGIPWNYQTGTRLLEVVATNLSVNRENIIEIEVPAGMYIVADSWTTSAENEAVKSVTFITNTSQGTGVYENAQTGKLRYTIESASTAVKLTCHVNFDRNIWNKSKGIATGSYLTIDPAVVVSLDTLSPIKINNISTSVAYSGSGTWGIHLINYPVNKVYPLDTVQVLNTSMWLIAEDQTTVSQYYKSLDISYTCYQTVNGVNIYADYQGATVTAQAQAGVGAPTVTQVGNETILHWDDYYIKSAAIGHISNVKYLLSSAMGFQPTNGSQASDLKLVIKYTFTDMTGFVHQFSSTVTSTIGVAELNYKNFSNSTPTISTPVSTWHESEEYLSAVGYTRMTYNSIVDAANIGVKIEFDYETGDGETPKSRVVLGRAPLPSGESTTAHITLIDSSGNQYGPFDKVLTSSSTQSGALVKASTIASNNGLSGTYYLKTIEYEIATVKGSSSLIHFYSSGGGNSLHTGGSWSGLLDANTKNRFTLNFPDGTSNSKIGTVSTSTAIKESEGIESITASKTTLTAGESFTLDVTLLSYDYPYGNVNHIKNPELYVLLPDGVSIDSACIKMSRTGAWIQDAIITPVKQIVQEGVKYNDYKLSFADPVHFGGYKVGGDDVRNDPNRCIHLELSTNPSMNAATIHYKEHFAFTQEGASNSISGAAARYKFTDALDLDNNGSTTNTLGGVSSSNTAKITINAKTTAKSLRLFDADKQIVEFKTTDPDNTSDTIDEEETND